MQRLKHTTIQSYIKKIQIKQNHTYNTTPVPSPLLKKSQKSLLYQLYKTLKNLNSEYMTNITSLSLTQPSVSHNSLFLTHSSIFFTLLLP